ncbi:hypothetical protein [Deinococcus sonorensis]|uniref:DUF4132 domain-containing protein n=2 Tax=Deinococcus sonorensis TaxID=309891 RepID=A0AAU7U6I3_9DEIO
MARHTSTVGLKRQVEHQRALGRCATQVDIIPWANTEISGPLRFTVGPRTVLIESVNSGAVPVQVPWQLVPQADLDQALRTLHAQILEEAHALPQLLTGAASSDPEAAAPRAVQRRLKRMLALRSLLELAAAWEDALVPGGVAPGWTAGPGRTVAVLPWHPVAVPVREGWHLHQLCRWHQPQPGTDCWAQTTAAWITRAALLQDVSGGATMTGPLPAGRAARDRQRKARASSAGRATPPAAPEAVDLDPDAFVRRARLALSAVLEPALASFPDQDVLRAVQGARSPAVALSRLLPRVAAGPVHALGQTLRASLRHGRPIRPDEGGRAAQAAGSCPVRRSAWTAARAVSVSPHRCLAAEAAAGPLHLLVPGLPHAGPASALLQDGRLSTALEEVVDLFTAVAALPAEQDLPLPDLSGVLTGRGHLRLGAHAGPDPLRTSEPDTPGPDDDWRQATARALLVVPGLTEAVGALQAVQAAREHALDRVREEACHATGLSEAHLQEAIGGERSFERTPGDPALERVLRWTGGVWSLRLARHPQDLVADGRALAHCVGWGGYAQRVRAGQVRIIRVLARGPDDERPVPLLTLELLQKENGEGPPAASTWRLGQARGLSNRLPTRDEATLIALWAREVGVQLDAASEVAPVAPTSLRSGRDRLAVAWDAVSVRLEPSAPPSSERQQEARSRLADAIAARWTPAATHQEGLRRVAALVERARTHLTTECLRLHAQGDPGLVGTMSGDDLLPGTGTLTLAPDPRPRLSALSDARAATGTSRLLGLRLERRLSLDVDGNLQARERRQTLELRAGKRPGELMLQYSDSQGAMVNTYLSPAALMNTGVLDPLHVDNTWTWGVARRRQAGLTLLWSVLDEPLGDLAAAATAVTAQPGATLRAQLTAFTGTAAARRSLQQ